MKRRVMLLVIVVFLGVFSYAPGAQGSLMKVTYIDVGQADSILVQAPTGQNMLIDAGNNGDAKTIEAYLKAQKISKIDVLISTHPHEDHEGALDNIINAFNVSKLYMNVKYLDEKGRNIEPGTKTHKDVLTAIKTRKLTAAVPRPGTVFKLGNAVCTILAPNSSKYDDLNDFSVVVKMKYNKISWLFEGDAEALSEKEMLDSHLDVDSDILKVGHHGSDSSTSDAFLRAVSPKYAVISVGKGNRFKHPYKATMNKLKANKVPVYRTDENKTIVCTSDGVNVAFNVKPGDYLPGGDR